MYIGSPKWPRVRAEGYLVPVVTEKLHPLNRWGIIKVRACEEVLMTFIVRNNSACSSSRANSMVGSEILFNQHSFIHNSINCLHSSVLTRTGAWINVQKLPKGAPSLPKCCQNLIKSCQSNSSIWTQCISALILQIIPSTSHCFLIL